MDQDDYSANQAGEAATPDGIFHTFPSGPGLIAAIWAIATALIVLDAVSFPDKENWRVSSNLYLAGVPIFAALVASGVLRLRQSALRLVVLIAGVDLVVGSIYILSEFQSGGAISESMIVSSAFMAVELLLCSYIIWQFCGHAHSRKRRAGAIASYVAVFFILITFIGLDPMFWQVSTKVSQLHSSSVSQQEDEDENSWEVETDRLWEAQPDLVGKQLSALDQPQSRKRNIYAIAVAAQGTQKLFSREVHNALGAFASGFGSEYRGGVLLSNGGNDFFQAPLATRGNIGTVARAIGKNVDPAKDVVVMYLAAHGGRDAVLMTDLPNYDRVQPISSIALAKALEGSGIRKRVIIISACYSGSWIPALANDDTIVITAAAADRTSFGCSDEREMTFFGEAFLKGSLQRGASLRDTFEKAKAKLEVWEKADGLTPSKPQAYVGKNMQDIWSTAQPKREIAATS